MPIKSLRSEVYRLYKTKRIAGHYEKIRALLQSVEHNLKSNCSKYRLLVRGDYDKTVREIKKKTVVNKKKRRRNKKRISRGAR